jgi:hypothetical protein
MLCNVYTKIIQKVQNSAYLFRNRCIWAESTVGLAGLYKGVPFNYLTDKYREWSAGGQEF